MASVDSPQWLSAADCASRTGLTVRALRVYEELGLIAPRRSAAGWRQYGPQDLVKLNTITLLKTAGLSLAQIGEITCSSADGPTLQQILQIQLDTWQRRRADAERGQTIAAAALNRLRSGQALSVDELCSLIRSLEMTHSSDGPASTSAVLDSHAGFYQCGEFGVATVWRDGSRLFIDAVELHPTSETEFYPTHGAGYFQYTFLHDAVLMRAQGVEFICPRIDAAAAEGIKARLRERVEGQQPFPGSKTALRRLIDGVQAGHPPYEEMSSQLKQLVLQQLPEFQMVASYLGELQSIEFRGVGEDGWDVYDVKREHGISQWRIVLSADGRIALANLDWDRPAPSRQ